MAERTDLPLIKPEGTPTLLNHEAASGTFWGLALGIVTGTVATFATKGNAKIGTAVAYATMAVGTVRGALKGKARMEGEEQRGQVVHSPSHWNHGLFSGWAISALLMQPVYIALHFMKAGPITRGIIGATGVVAGMIVGSNQRYAHMKRDVARATALQEAQQKQGLYGQLSQGLYTNTVTPEELKRVEQKQQTGKPASAEPQALMHRI